MGFTPARDHLDIFGYLADGGAHSSLGHAMRAAEIELDSVGPGRLDPWKDTLPGFFLAGHHERHDDGAIRPAALHLRDFLKVDLQGSVGDKLDVVEGRDA